MLMLTAVQTAQPDFVALAIVGVFAVIVAVLAIRKKCSAKAPAAEVETPASVTEAEPVYAPGSAGQIKLHDVEPRTAALLMAIVANKTGKPLNELRFISVKEVK